jgi:cation:H+ antiporter
MLLDVVIITLGFVGLTWGADKFVFGSSALAKNLGVSPLMIGLTIVAFGTSAPEIFSSAVAVLEGEPALAIGNAIGSNIFNIGVALAAAVLIKPLTPPGSLLRKEMPVLLLVTCVTGLLFYDGYLGIIDGVILLTVMAGLGYSLVRRKTVAGSVEDDDDEEDEEDEPIPEMSTLRAAAYLGLGLLLLILSAEALVNAASSIAIKLGVSSGVIGLTIVALGTSLPELATTIACALRGHHDLAIGNIVGSNIMNLLMVLPFPALMAPGLMEDSLVSRDYVTMLLMTLLLAAISFRAIRGGKQIGRLSGSAFLLMYLGWFALLVFQL